MLGICLGSQIVARALGGRCYDLGVPEVGFVPLRLTSAAASDPVLGQSFADPLHLAQFHSQTFDLPAGATRLMVGEQVPNQAFRFGRATYSFQPHFEVTPAMMTSWVAGSEEIVPTHYPTLPRSAAAPAPAPPPRQPRLLLARRRRLARAGRRAGAGVAGTKG